MTKACREKSGRGQPQLPWFPVESYTVRLHYIAGKVGMGMEMRFLDSISSV